MSTPLAAAKELTLRVLQDAGGAFVSANLYLGWRLGLLERLKGGLKFSASSLSKELGLNERYTLEWLKGMVAAGYAECSDGCAEFWLNEAQRMVLCEETSACFAGGAFRFALPSILQLEDIEEHFRAGGGIAFHQLPAEMSDALDALHRAWFEHLLVQQWFPAEPRIDAFLREGGSLLEVGCGRGRAAIAIAKAYPKAQIVGLDAHAPSIEAAAELALEAGLKNVRFVAADLESYQEESFDVVLVIDTVHDMQDPVAALRTMNTLLKPHGFIFWSEPAGSDDPRENRATATRMRQNLSIYHCLTLSLAIGGAGLGTLIGERGARRLAQEAGFTACRRLAIESAVQQFFVLDRF